MVNKKIWIYLDDIRTPADETWTVVRSYEEFVALILNVGLDNVERISFDHDLGDTAMREYYENVRPNYTIDYSKIEEKTGYDCVKWLVNHGMDTGEVIPKVYVHSANPIGAANILGYINNYYKNFRMKMRAELYYWDIKKITDDKR
jgi:hypothetical protein